MGKKSKISAYLHHLPARSKAAKKVAHGVYSTLRKQPWFSEIRAERKRKKKAELAAKREKMLAEAFAGMEDITAAEANIRAMSMKSYADNELRFDVFGRAEGLACFDYEALSDSLTSVLGIDDVRLRITVADASEKRNNIDAYQYLKERNQLEVICPGEALLVDTGTVRTLFIAFNMKRENPIPSGELVIDPLVIKQIAYARNNNVDYVMAYALRDPDTSVPATPYEQDYIRRIANLGCRYVVASNECGIRQCGKVKKIDGRYSHVFDSLGTMFGQSKAFEPGAAGASLVLRVELLKNGTHILTSESYLPLFHPEEGMPRKAIVRIDSSNSEHMNSRHIRGAYEYLTTNVGRLKDNREIIKLGEIFDTLGLQIPEKYAYMRRRNIGKICLKSFEVMSGDVFFFHEPYAKNTEPPEVRMRQVDKALARGAVFVFSYTKLEDDVPHVVVDNCLEAHVAVCARLRSRSYAKAIGITGSVGKTSTKDMLANIMAKKYRTFANTRNLNSQADVGMNIQSLRGEYGAFVQEIGGSRLGAASRLSRIVAPEAAVVTNIGTAHIGNFGTQKELARHKLGIADGLTPNGVLYLNGDDPLLVNAKQEFGLTCKTVLFALDNHDADYYADNIVDTENGATFDIVHNLGDGNIEHCAASVPVLGRHNILNAVCCYAVAKQFRISDEQIIAGISEYLPTGTRQNLMKVAGRTLYVDCFNASPTSVDSSLSVLDALKTQGRKIAVIGDITGAGEHAAESHREVGDIALKHHADTFVFYGENSKISYGIAKAAGLNAHHFTSEAELSAFLRDNVLVGDACLFKGSSKVKLGERIDQVFGTQLSDQDMLDEGHNKVFEEGGVSYNVFAAHASVFSSDRNVARLEIKSKVSGVPVVNLGVGCFSNLDKQASVKLPDHLRHIGDDCFSSAGSLTQVELPSSMLFVGNRAFSGCRSLTAVKLNEGLAYIGDEAFKNCFKLTQLYLPATLQQIGKNAFAGCDNLVVYGESGSYAERYCHDNGLAFKVGSPA